MTTYCLFQKLSAAPPKNIILFGLNPCAGLVVTVATPVLLVCVIALTCNPVPAVSYTHLTLPTNVQV